MDDQRTNRKGGVRRRFQLSVGRVLGATFWTCIFLAALSLALRATRAARPQVPDWVPKSGWGEACFGASVVVLLFVAPCIAIATLFRRPIVGAIVGLSLLGVFLLCVMLVS